MKPSKTYSFTSEKLFLVLYCTLFGGSALEAYNIAFVPIEWLIKVGLIAVVLFLGFTRGVYIVPGSRVLLSFFFWALLVTAANSLFTDYASIMPSLATTPYPIFISLRFLNILSFVSALYLTWWLLVKGYKDRVIKWTVVIGFIFALLAIYIYIAQIYGFPELPRTRMSTGGQTDAYRLVRFSYAFHRATGTFREPSHLAEWLVLPFLLSLGLARYRKSFFLYATLIGAVILLTGSLTGIIGTAIGLLGAMLFSMFFNFRGKSISFFYVTLSFLFALGIFYVVSVPYEEGTKSIFHVILERLTPVIEKGLEGTNRAYIYQYLANVPFPIFGYGLGHANLLLSKYLGIQFVGAYLNLYVNTLFSTGIIGLVLLCLFVLSPVIRAITILRKTHPTNRLLLILAAYFSWLVMFAVRAEELGIMFAVAFALLAHEIYH